MRTIIPRYARLPMLTALTYNCAVFWLTRPLTRGAAHYDLSLSLDTRLPFVPAFIVIYILAFFQWLIGYILIVRDSRERCDRVLSGEMIAKTVCLICFLFLPTAMERPRVTGTDPFSRLTALIFALDTPDNLFPSIHCLESWICFRCLLGARTAGRGCKIFMLIFTLLVFASTVLVKQHLVLDILGGVAAAELGQLLARQFDTGRFFRLLRKERRGEHI